MVTALLAVGAVAGAFLAASGLIRTDTLAKHALPAEALARVNAQLILRDHVERVTRDVAQKRNVPVDERLRRSVVDGLIDEELLVQRGITLGLAHIDRRLRSGLTRAALDRILSEQPEASPTDPELQRFLAAHPEIFAPAVKLRLRQVFIRVALGNDAEALARAQRATERLRAGEDFTAVRTQVGDPELAPVPDALLTRAKLLDYIGPTVLQAAAALAPGETGDPVRSGNGYHVVQVMDREAAVLPDLARVRDQVLKEVHRRAGDAWLRQTLDHLRSDADITINESAVTE